MAVKMVATGWRKEGWTAEKHSERWRNEHAKLVTDYKDALGIVRYVQSHAIPSPEMDEFSRSRGWAPAPHGLAELWWDSEESLKKAFSSPEGMEASRILALDEAVFVDMDRTMVFLSKEYEIFNDFKDK